MKKQRWRWTIEEWNDVVLSSIQWNGVEGRRVEKGVVWCRVKERNVDTKTERKPNNITECQRIFSDCFWIVL
jgi:hypothetical protein